MVFPRAQRAGFTIVELLLYMGLLAGFLVVLTDILVTALDVRSEGTGSGFVSTEGQYLRERMLYDIRRASAISAPASAGQSGSTFTLTIGGTSYAYASTSGQLTLTISGASSQLHSDAVRLTNFSATRVGNGTGDDTLAISYTLESTTLIRGQPAETMTFSLTGGLR